MLLTNFCFILSLPSASATSDLRQAKYYKGERIKNYETDGTHSKHGQVRNAYKILVGKPEGERPLGRPRRRWEDIKIALRGMGCKGLDRIHLTQERLHWRTFGFHKRREIYWLYEWLSASPKGLCCMLLILQNKGHCDDFALRLRPTWWKTLV